MFKRRMSIASATIVAVLAALTSCSSSTSPSADGSPQSSSGTGNASAPDSGTDAVTLTFWTLIDPDDMTSPRSEALRNSLSDFAKAEPNITIKVETLPWPQLSSKLLQAGAAGDTPDVVRLLAWDLPKHVAANQLMDLNEFASDEYKKDWLLGWDALSFDGKKFAVPMEYRSPVLYYRTDYSPGVAPTSWQDMVEKSKNSSDPHAGVMQGFSPKDQGTAFGEPLVSYLRDAGLDLFDKEGHIAFDSAKGYEVFDNFANLVKDGITPEAALAYVYEDEQNDIVSGGKEYSILGSHRIDTIRKSAEVDRETLAVAPLPSMFGNKTAPAHVNGWTYAIPKGTDHADAAWKFIEFLTTAESQLATVKLTGELPTRTSPYSDPWFKSEAGADSKMLADWFQSNGATVDYGTHWVEFNEIASNAISEMVRNGISGEEAVKSIATQYNAISG